MQLYIMERKCTNCGKNFIVDAKKKYEHTVLYPNSKHIFCNNHCYSLYKAKQRINLICFWCKKQFSRTKSEIKNKSRTSGKSFCSHSCAMFYNNTQIRKSCRSKCEKMLYDLLSNKYPNLEILKNDKIVLNGFEIDIFMPKLNLGIEWNGIVHFKPIYGLDRLNKIQERDAKKQKIANDKGINLIVIPDLVSTKQKVHEAFAKICGIIDQLH